MFFLIKNLQNFLLTTALKKQVEDEFEQKLQNLDVSNEFYPAMLENITELKNEKLEAIEALIKKRKRRFKKLF